MTDPRPLAEPSPVFLIGAARSGTSLLYKLLCLHPDVAYFSNWIARFPRLTWLAAFNRIGARLPSFRLRVWFGSEQNAYVYGSKRPLIQRLFPMPVEGEPLYKLAGVAQHVGPAPDPAARQLSALRNSFEAVRRFAGGSRLINKRIANNRRLPLLAQAFPGARFIEIVRDGRAVAYSLSRVDWWEDSVVWWYGQTPRRWRQEGKDPWEICARNWVEELREIERGLTGIRPELRLRLRYEEFVQHPLPTLERVADFIGLERSGQWTEQVAGLTLPNRNEAWRRHLDPDSAARITAIQAESLRRNGYSL